MLGVDQLLANFSFELDSKAATLRHEDLSKLVKEGRLDSHRTNQGTELRLHRDFEKLSGRCLLLFVILFLLLPILLPIRLVMTGRSRLPWR